MTRLLALPAGRRAKWVVLAVWLVVLFASLGAQPRRQVRGRREERVDVVPARARPSRPRRWTPSKRIQGGERVAAVVVYRRDGGLTAADKARIARRRRASSDAAGPSRSSSQRRAGARGLGLAGTAPRRCSSRVDSRATARAARSSTPSTRSATGSATGRTAGCRSR